MTTEEKARAYDEALERAKTLYENANGMILKKWVEQVFPELAESEDEKVRKEIIDFLKLPHPQFVGKRDHEKWLAWLEKQGSLKDIIDRAKDSWYNEGKIAGMAEGLTDDEKYQQGWHDALEKLGEQEKDILEDAILDGNEDGLIADTIRYKHEKQSKQKLDKVEPKFKVGDWIINPRTGLIKHIKNVLLCDNNGNYEFESSSMSIDSVDNSFHLWTIQDAKDGDVLANDNEIVIFKENNFNQKDLSGCMFVHCSLHSKKGYWYTIGGINPSNYVPATKEQRNLLFRKMKEAGYEWDAGKKELKKINSYCQENCKGFQETGKCFADGECKAKREAEQKSVIWSEEDEDHVNSLLKRLKGLCRKEFTTTRFAINEDEDWLKSLRGRVQPKQEWSEEDSYYRNHIIQIIEEINNAPLKRGEDWEAYINWLKSLRPQKCLIPSEEEIEKAAQEWDSKANFNPFYMTMENGKPTGVKQSITTHKESFKAGIYWILKSLNS